MDPNINRWTGKPHEHKREIAHNRGRFCAKHVPPVKKRTKK